MSLTMKAPSARSLVNLFKPVSLMALLGALGAGCSDEGRNGSSSSASGTAGIAAVAGASTTAGTGGSVVAGTGGSATSSGASGSSTGGAGTGGSTNLGGTGGVGGGLGGAGGSAAGAGGSAGITGSGGSVDTLPGDYKGTPYAALKIPGRINAADYDRGGAGVAWCHDTGNCKSGTVTGDYPQASGVYRAPMPANATLCSGAACDDNVGVCRMNPSKPDNTIMGQAMPATDTYLCYSVAGEWTKYTVIVEQAGTYSVGGVMAVPQAGAFNLSFGATITTGNVPVAITPTTNSGSGENYHSWDTRSGLAIVTFPAAGTYLMTFTQVGRFNADAFTFTKT